MAVDPRDFLLNTDYEMDKIILVESGKVNPNETKTIPHGLSFSPMVFGCCAFNEDFSDSRSIPFWDDFVAVTSSGGGTLTAKVSAYVDADASNVYIKYDNSQQNPSPLYYRVFGFETPDENKKVGPTSKYAKVFNINTDRNYRKLYKQGSIVVGNKQSVEHNLGYYPQVESWFDYGNFMPGHIQQTIGETFYSKVDHSINDATVTITDTDVQFDLTDYSPLLEGAKYYYRIYYDEA